MTMERMLRLTFTLFYCVPRKFSLRVFYSYLYLIISNVLWDRIPLLLCPYTLFFKNLYYSITYSHIFFTWNDACRVFYIFEMKRRFSHATLYPIQLRYTFLVLINPRNAILSNRYHISYRFSLNLFETFYSISFHHSFFIEYIFLIFHLQINFSEQRARVFVSD